MSSSKWFMVCIMLFSVSAFGEESSMWTSFQQTAADASKSLSKAYDDANSFTDAKVAEAEQTISTLIPALEDAGYKVNRVFFSIEIGVPTAGLMLTRDRILSETELKIVKDKYQGEQLIMSAINLLNEGAEVQFGSYQFKSARLKIFPILKSTFYLDDMSPNLAQSDEAEQQKR